MFRRGLLLLFWLSLVIHAVYIPPNRKLLHAKRDSLDFETGHDHTHTCIKCPPGTHQAQSCETPGTKATCSPCTDGVDYTEYANVMPYCLPCKRCKLGQEEASRCSTTRNTECRCKEGTYCPPDHPCEACVRCKSSCPEGEDFISPCNATADAQCAKPTGPPATQDHNGLPLILSLVVLFVIIVVVIIYCVYKKLTQNPSEGGRSPSACGSYTSAVQRFKRYHQNSRTQESRDNHANNSRDAATNPILPHGENNALGNNHLLRQGDKVQPLDNRRPNGTKRVSYNLIPVDGSEAQALQDSFLQFVDNVSNDSWSFFMRKLGLTNIEIDIVYADYRSGGTREARFQMLCRWHDQIGVNLGSVNTLLQALHDLELGHISENISAQLLEKNLYKPLQES